MNFDIVVLAPHATVPPFDGASLRAVELAFSLMRQGKKVLLVANKEDLHDYQAAGQHEPRFEERGKLFSAIFGILTLRGYNGGKHLTTDWIRRAKRALRENPKAIVHIHFLWSLPPLWTQLRDRFSLIDTHNFDPEWFRNLMGASKNPLVRILGRVSEHASLRYLTELRTNNHTLLHCTERDMERYMPLAPQVSHRVIPNGCKIRPRKTSPAYDVKRKEVYFLGLLSAKMNVDALCEFAQTVWPKISHIANMTVIGRTPNQVVETLCSENKWNLMPNASEEQLEEKLELMHYAIMPFSYGAGSKLKLLDATARGIPVISTPQGATGYDDLPKGVRIVDSIDDWVCALSDSRNPTEEDTDELLNFARCNSWDFLARELVNYLPSKASGAAGG